MGTTHNNVVISMQVRQTLCMVPQKQLLRYLLEFSSVLSIRLNASATKLYGDFGPFKWGCMEAEFATGVFTLYDTTTQFSNTGVSGSSKDATCFNFNSDNISNIFNSSTDILRPLSLQVRWFIKY